MRHYCGLSDVGIATDLGIANGSLLRRLHRHGIPVDPSSHRCAPRRSADTNQLV